MIHFVGIGGAGMCGLAEILLSEGRKLSGCDLRWGRPLERLAALGARVLVGHDPAHLEGCELLVVSRAVPPTQEEIVWARRLGIPVWPRARMLAELLRARFSLGVAGTHGKTTTTALTATALAAAGYDPCVLVGAEVREFCSHARAGKGPVVAEVDESDGSLREVAVNAAVVTSMDLSDHADHYRTWSQLQQTFASFIRAVPSEGFVVLCGEIPEVAALAEVSRARVFRYGFGTGEVRARILGRKGLQVTFAVTVEGREQGEVRLPLPGAHNVLNATGALAAGLALGAPFELMVQALERFQGISRRFEVHCSDPLVVDDYAHNPVKVRAFLRALREVKPDARILAVFQPHRYSRTATTYAQFAQAFDDADELVVTEIYPADEPPIPGVSAQLIVWAVQPYRPVVWIPDLEGVAEYVRGRLRSGDVLATMGAGDVWKVARWVTESLCGEKG
ncbi:MAG: UDP-N-acetylmuramate--L-alanine ligase [Armatimonadetes bacterium]|nr:UDP-N-acetylmuramate--L-alanine ligase [Armatimonadota bacterium]MDW8153078.1 UDP-N-acetylmuramate--L-alanine ligase [Armatimonadota bacterium]